MKRIFGYITVLVFLLASASCSLNSSTNSTTVPESAFRVTHLSPDEGPLDIYLGGNLAYQYLTYTYYTSYIEVQPGTYSFMCDAANTKTSVVSAQFPFVSDIFYSIFIIDSANAISTAVVQDNLSVSTDSAKIRILDFAPIGDTVNIATIDAPPIAVASNARTFNDVTANSTYGNFFSVPPGTYTFNVVQPSTSAILALQSGTGTLTFQAGKIYTVVLTGVVNDLFNTQSLAMLSIPNN
jgi:hypothetical protein